MRRSTVEINWRVININTTISATGTREIPKERWWRDEGFPVSLRDISKEGQAVGQECFRRQRECREGRNGAVLPRKGTQCGHTKLRTRVGTKKARLVHPGSLPC